MGENVQGNDDPNHMFYDSHGGHDLDVEELLCNIQCRVLLENKMRGFNNLVMIEKASKELLYDEFKGCVKECTILQMVLYLLTLKA
jgi:hypothetical protein